MDVGQIRSNETTIPGLAWARRLLRRQLDTLGRLASAVVRMMEAPSQAAFERPSINALEKALNAHCRINWAMRLLDALRRKLRGDLDCVERGEMPEIILQAPPEPQKPDRPDKRERGESGLREPYDRESFGRFLGPSSDKDIAKLLQRPTDEILALIAKELGLPDDWLREAEEAWDESEASDVPFPLEGGRVGDGGDSASAALTAPEPPPKPPPWPRFV